MTLFHVQPGGYQSLKVYSPRLGRTLAFVDGAFSTSDPDEIRVLRRNRHCFDMGELESDLTAPDPPEGVDRALVDEDLALLKAAAATLGDDIDERDDEDRGE